MDELEKYKIALFGVIRNSKVLSKGLLLGKSIEEIDKMSYETMEAVFEMIDFEEMKKHYEVGKNK